VLRGDDIKDPEDRNPPYWMYSGGGKRLVFSSNHLNRETLQDFVGEIEKFRPDVLHAYPTILDSFCNLLLSSYSRPVIPITICSSEVLAVESWQRSRTAIETQMIDYYGQAERVTFAYAFEPQSYRFLPGYSYNELLPVEGEEGTYELVCTGLWNLAMPLVRFRTGDLVRVPLGTDLNAIAFGTETFAGVIGRSGDYLIAPDGARLMGIDHIPRDVDHVVRMQVIQESPERVRILVIPGDGFSEPDRLKIESNARLKLPPPMRWGVEIVDALERNSSGKAPYVIRR
jgi:phenylacetate-coenzyme A ligase PaaK-like adenylate-forming protein